MQHTDVFYGGARKYIEIYYNHRTGKADIALFDKDDFLINGVSTDKTVFSESDMKELLDSLKDS